MNIIDSQGLVYVKEAVCQYLNNNPQGDFSEIKTENIITLRIVDDSIIALVDCGIKGIPKFTIPADKLEFNPKPISNVEFPPIGGKDKILDAAKPEYSDTSDSKPKPKTKRQAVNGRRKRGAKK